jgi:hypothetical protein
MSTFELGYQQQRHKRVFFWNRNFFYHMLVNLLVDLLNDYSIIIVGFWRQ